jgi:hypothetical protein
MKAMFILVAVIAVAGLAVYQYGGVGDFDPTKQGEEARSKIQAGKTWQQVVDDAGEPNYFRSMVIKTRRTPSGPVESIVPGGQNKYNASIFGKRATGEGFPNGFLFEYRFSERVAFAVHFDATGAVTGTSDLTTTADLLDQR